MITEAQLTPKMRSSVISGAEAMEYRCRNCGENCILPPQGGELHCACTAADYLAEPPFDVYAWRYGYRVALGSFSELMSAGWDPLGHRLIPKT